MAGNYVVHPHGRQDLDTGRMYDFDGNEIPSGVDETLKAELNRFMGPRTATLVGNQADLQVMGARAALEHEEGIELPNSPRHVHVPTEPQVPPSAQGEAAPPSDAPEGGQVSGA